jgi:uncharacterized protein (DUF1800 family)
MSERSASATPTLSRRQMLRTAALGAGVAVGGSTLSTLVGTAPAVAGTSAAAFVPADLDLHLLRRATYGATPNLLTQVRSAGRNAWLDRQLAPASIDDSACEDLIADRYPHLSWSLDQAWNNLNGDWSLMMELGQAAIARAAWSKRQLFEVMVDFWSNHLNVTNPFDGGWWCRHDYDKRVVRKHALGRFADMLVASATHPAMMLYLNNAESTKDNPNENYGRELLELHTVGVDAGYSEEDMRQSTLVMTGFGMDWDDGHFVYSPWAHYTGPVQVMGWSAANDREAKGYDVGLSYLGYLARHPATAQRLAEKLCQRFVSDDPPQTLVDKLAATYLEQDTAIVPVLRKLFRSPEFAASLGQKIRRPMEDTVATLRILGVKADPSGTDGIQGLYWMIEDLAHAPMAWSPPNGYPDEADAWRSAGGTLGRWNMHMSIAGHWWPEELVRPPLKDLLPAKHPKTHGELVNVLAKRLVFRTMSTEHRDAVLGFLGRSADDPVNRDSEALGWRLPYLVALILDSPYHEVR